MKRLFIGLAGLIATLAFIAAMTASTASASVSVPSKFCVDGHNVNANDYGSASGYVASALYTGATRLGGAYSAEFPYGQPQEPGEDLVTQLLDDDDAVYVTRVPPAIEGVHWAFHPIAVGNCANFVPPPASVGLCYSKWQVDPMFQLYPVAKDLVASGYWLPYAIKSAVSQTNIGNGYYLVCNLPPGMTQGSLAIGGGGEEYSGQQALGLFASNPLDFYHNAS